ncbi:transcription initiation factor TFIID subunit 2 [Babesia caballi]|uniref:Transcription initiation factor TFIID subunit 2 n=1 Tax=Babesia caballi TaxID=5871 RepID=A0AAV4LY45_BABCB|nr:transcription initiation factor TFIID subunit 2 [Babesia caballi]
MQPDGQLAAAASASLTCTILVAASASTMFASPGRPPGVQLPGAVNTGGVGVPAGHLCDVVLVQRLQHLRRVRRPGVSRAQPAVTCSTLDSSRTLRTSVSPCPHAPLAVDPEGVAAPGGAAPHGRLEGELHPGWNVPVLAVARSQDAERANSPGEQRAVHRGHQGVVRPACEGNDVVLQVDAQSNRLRVGGTPRALFCSLPFPCLAALLPAVGDGVPQPPVTAEAEGVHRAAGAARRAPRQHQHGRVVVTARHLADVLPLKESDPFRRLRQDGLQAVTQAVERPLPP